MIKSFFITTCLLLGLVPSFKQFGVSDFAESFDEIRFNRSNDVRARVWSNLYEGDEDEVQIPFPATVYLLPESAVEILKRKKFAPIDEEGVELTDEQSYLDAAAYSLGQKNDESELLGFLIYEALNEAKIAKIKTGAKGKGAAAVNSGSYYLFAAEQIDNEIFVWHFPVNLYHSGSAAIEIDQYNAAAVIPVE